MILKSIVTICGILITLATIGNTLKSTPENDVELMCKVESLLTGLIMIAMGLS